MAETTVFQGLDIPSSSRGNVKIRSGYRSRDRQFSVLAGSTKVLRLQRTRNQIPTMYIGLQSTSRNDKPGDRIRGNSFFELHPCRSVENCLPLDVKPNLAERGPFALLRVFLQFDWADCPEGEVDRPVRVVACFPKSLVEGGELLTCVSAIVPRVPCSKTG